MLLGVGNPVVCLPLLSGAAKEVIIILPNILSSLSNLTISKPTKGYKKVIFCMYKKIDIEDKHFLQYLLYKNKETSNLYMPFIDEKDSVKDFIKKVIDKQRYTLLGYRIFKECLLTFISIINANCTCQAISCEGYSTLL